MANFPSRYGFRSGDRGTHGSRSIMLAGLRRVLEVNPGEATYEEYRASIWANDPEGRPLLALLCVCARDPLLRMSAPVILEAPIGSVVTSEDFARTIQTAAPDRFRATTLRSMGQNLYSSWTQSGHLAGGRVRKRTHPVVTPEATAYALVLGRLTGSRGQLLFSTFWTALLDAPSGRLFELAAAAWRRGWIDLRRAGSVVEVRFSKLLTPDEEEAVREPD